jgi:hypothetical protein
MQVIKIDPKETDTNEHDRNMIIRFLENAVEALKTLSNGIHITEKALPSILQGEIAL